METRERLAERVRTAVSALDALGAATLLLDARGDVVAVNETWRTLLERLVPEQTDGGVGWRYADVCEAVLALEADRKRCLEGLRGVLQGALPSFRLDDVLILSERPAHFRMTLTPLPGREGVLVAHLDITEAKEAEGSFEQLLESPMDALVVVDARGVVRLVNARAEALFGYTRAELVGAGLHQLLPERLRAQHAEHQAHFFAAPHARPMGSGLELFARHKNGSEFPVEISLTPLQTAHTRVVVAAVRDVSARKLGEKALREGEQRLALHIRQTPLAVIEWRLPDLLITAWNPAAERIFGYRADEVVGRQSAALLVADDPDRRAFLGGRSEATSGRRTTRNRTKDGRLILCEWYSTLLTDEAGRETGVAALAMDVTARQQAIEALLSAQDEERTRISRDLHDGVGQALTALSLGLKRAQEGCDAPQLGDLKALVAQTLEEVRRISRALRPALLDELGLEAAVKQFARELSERSQVEIDVLARLPGRLPRNEEAAVYRVVQEALTNVVKHAHAAHASVVLTADGGRLHLIVEDDGVGFVLSEAAAQSGVGLLGMRERIELLGGTLRLESTPGRGTIISAKLPLRRWR